MSATVAVISALMIAQTIATSADRGPTSSGRDLPAPADSAARSARAPQPGDTATFATPAVRAIVTRATTANRELPAGLEAYRARVESEIGLVLNITTNAPGAIAGTAAGSNEVAGQVEQFQSDTKWDRSGAYEQHVIGYRGQLTGPSFSALTWIRRSWTVPLLYGNRLAFLFGMPAAPADSQRARAVAGPAGDSTTARPTVRPTAQPTARPAADSARPRSAIHPLATDADRFYQYTGGDTVAQIGLATRVVTVVRVVVEPRSDASSALLLFGGELFLDAERAELIRMRGRLFSSGSAGGPGSRAPLAARLMQRVARLQGVAFIDFENAEVLGRYWLPRRQRLEFQAMTSLTETRPIMRIVSQWREMDVTAREVVAGAPRDSMRLARYQLNFAPEDSLRAYNDWRREIGATTREVTARDFDDVAPERLRPTGAPRFTWQARRLGDVVRYNRVEGLYTGVAGTLAFRDLMPGLQVRGIAGWAWSARTPKGGLEAALVRGSWVTSLRLERLLASTNDFSRALGGGGSALGGLFGRDESDWVDRRVALIGVTRELGTSHAAAIRVEGGWAEDVSTPMVESRGVFGGDFRPNRAVAAGRFALTSVSLELGRNAGMQSAQGGTRTTIGYQRGDGALNWQRVSARFESRHWLGPLLFGARADAAWLIGAHLPPQQLLEVGGVEGLPGYDYKAFAGDKAVIARATLGYQLPFWTAPLRMGGLVLPGVAPMPSIGIFAGRTGADATTAVQMQGLGWVTTQGTRATFDARVRFFGGAFSVGASRALDRPAGWKLLVAFGGQL